MPDDRYFVGNDVTRQRLITANTQKAIIREKRRLEATTSDNLVAVDTFDISYDPFSWWD